MATKKATSKLNSIAAEVKSIPKPTANLLSKPSLSASSLTSAFSNLKPTVKLPTPESPTTPAPTTPSAPSYDTSAYDRMIAAYEAKMRADAEAAKKAKAAEYDAQAKSAYIARLQNERTLSDNLARAGIRGGTSETTGARLLSNYENNRNQIEANKSAALTGIDKDAGDKIFDYTQTQEAAKLQYIQAREAETRQIAETMRQEAVQAAESQKERDYNSSEAQAERDWQTQQTSAANKLAAQKEAQAKKEAQKQAKRDEWIGTISRLDTVKKCEAKIKQINKWKKTDPDKYERNKWKINYISAQMASLKAKAEAEAKKK